MVQNIVEKEWTVDTVHSNIGFSIRHMMISTVRGKFKSYTAKIIGDATHPETLKAEVNVDWKSIDTDNEMRDNDLRTDKTLLGDDKFPFISFKTGKVEVSGENLKVSGMLGIHGIQKRIELTGEYGGKIIDPYGNERFGLSMKGQINRKEFGLKWNKLMEGGGAVLSDIVNLDISLEAFSKP